MILLLIKFYVYISIYQSVLFEKMKTGFQDFKISSFQDFRFSRFQIFNFENRPLFKFEAKKKRKNGQFFFWHWLAFRVVAWLTFLQCAP